MEGKETNGLIWKGIWEFIWCVTTEQVQHCIPYKTTIIIIIKVKVHPRTGHEGPEWEQMYSSTLPSTSALDVSG